MKVRTPAELLTEARALIAKGWCQGASARDVHGIPADFWGQKAVTFCMSGALCRMENFIFDAHRTSRNILYSVIEVNNLATWNDREGRTQEEVLAAFDKAIAIAKDLDISERIR